MNALVSIVNSSSSCHFVDTWTALSSLSNLIFPDSLSWITSISSLFLLSLSFLNFVVFFFIFKDRTYEDCKSCMHSLSPMMPLTHNGIIYLKNWELSTNSSWDNEKSRRKKKKIQTQKTQKTDAILKLESRELISYIADLTGLFIISGVNKK